MNRRLALVAALALLLGAALFTALPSSTANSKCGWWFAPEFHKAESQKLAAKALALIDDTPGMESSNDEVTAFARQIATQWRDCHDKLATRRNISIGLLIAAGLVPAGILYVTKREDQTATL